MPIYFLRWYIGFVFSAYGKYICYKQKVKSLINPKLSVALCDSPDFLCVTKKEKNLHSGRQRMTLRVTEKGSIIHSTMDESYF